MAALEVIQSAWPMLVGATALATLAFLRILSVYAEKHIVKHDVIREAKDMRRSYLESKVEKLPTGEWEVVDD